jgi:hypothetical protein
MFYPRCAAMTPTALMECFGKKLEPKTDAPPVAKPHHVPPQASTLPLSTRLQKLAQERRVAENLKP